VSAATLTAVTRATDRLAARLDGVVVVIDDLRPETSFDLRLTLPARFFISENRSLRVDASIPASFLREDRRSLSDLVGSSMAADVKTPRLISGVVLGIVAALRRQRLLQRVITTLVSSQDTSVPPARFHVRGIRWPSSFLPPLCRASI